MTRAGVTIILVVLAGACDADVLIGNDAGIEVDAGLSDAGVADAGSVDAGLETDAGIVDAGPQPDAGFPCPFPDNPPQDVPCEDDGDYCDPVEPRFSPEADLLATWSHVDGEEFVMQARFLAPPFRLIRRLHLQFLVGEATSADHGAGIPRDQDGEEIYGDVAYSLFQDRRFPAGWAFPPPISGTVSRQSETPAFSECWFSLSTTTGLVELRVPLAAVQGGRYAVGAEGADDVTPTSDVSWSSAPGFLATGGGHADDEDTLVSICDLSCPF